MGVEKITAYKDSLGNIHESKREAVMADADLKITQFFGAKHISPQQVKAIIHNARGMIKVLEPVVAAIEGEEIEGGQ